MLLILAFGVMNLVAVAALALALAALVEPALAPGLHQMR
jgi:hypothetical protein